MAGENMTGRPDNIRPSENSFPKAKESGPVVNEAFNPPNNPTKDSPPKSFNVTNDYK